MLEDIAFWELVGLVLYAKPRFDLPTADPFKVIKTGPGLDYEGDPMKILEKELKIYQYVKIPEIPTFTGKNMSSPLPLLFFFSFD